MLSPMRPILFFVVFALALGSCSKREPSESEPPPIDETTDLTPVTPPTPLPERSSDPAIAALDDYIRTAAPDRTRPGWRTRLHAPPKVAFTPGKVYVWKIVTNLGSMDVQLLPEVAPQHVTNFIYLTRMGFFDGLTFHRVVRGFMAQGGDPLGTGMGMPGYGLAPEVDRSVRHDRRGVVSTAHSNQRNSDGSQFFVMFGPKPELDISYAIFGRVFQGSATLDKIEALGVDPAGDPPGTPRGKIVIEHATIDVR
jgi:cyclophilin family peptidyl-prolyl cis-trans isomerase